MEQDDANTNGAAAKLALPPSMPAPTLDVSRAPPALVDLITSYLVAKSAADVPSLLRHISADVATYTDAPMGWAVNGYDALAKAYATALSHYGEGRSYPTLIMGDLEGGDGSALVQITNTPEIVGSELRMLSTIDIRDSKIIRIVDYWDSLSFDDAMFAEMANKGERPVDYLEGKVGTAAAPRFAEVATRLQSAMAAGTANAAMALFDDDAVAEDMSLRVQVIGKAAIGRYLSRVLVEAPFGLGARLRHVVGGDMGGGLEWVGSAQSNVEGGVTALRLAADGRITRATTVYDSRQLTAEQRCSLILLSTSG